MLSRIIRHPAGFMKRALRRNFLSVPFARPGAAAQRPDYWLSRFSGLGLSLLAARGPAAPAPSLRQPPAPGPGTPATATPDAAGAPGAPGVRGNGPQASLPRQGGKAASFLLAGTQRADHP
jgi:hypothetical protein